jgi:hypothetical protein
MSIGDFRAGWRDTFSGVFTGENRIRDLSGIYQADQGIFAEKSHPQKYQRLSGAEQGFGLRLSAKTERACRHTSRC